MAKSGQSIKTPELSLRSPQNDWAPIHQGLNRTFRASVVVPLLSIFVLSAALLTFVARNPLSAWLAFWVDSRDPYAIFVFAIGGFWLWRKRHELVASTFAADWRAIPLAGLIAFLTGTVYLLNVQLAQLVLYVLGLATLVWAVCGPKVCLVTAPSLAIGLLALPAWHYVEQALQVLTIRATVICLRVLGIPVYVDETFIQVPQGAVVVLAECGGMQFLRAGLTLGILVAAVNLRSLSRRTLVVAAFSAASVLGNWLRVLALVLIGHVGDLQHWNVGWFVFVISLIPAALLANRLSRGEVSGASPDRTDRTSQWPKPSRSYLPNALIAVAATALLVALPVALQSRGAPLESSESTLDPIRPTAPWSGPETDAKWNPAFPGATATSVAAFRLGGSEDSVSMYRATYVEQRQGAEAINERNSVFDERRWRTRSGTLARKYHAASLETGTTTVIETDLESIETGARRMIWSWYSVAGRCVVQPLAGKLAQLRGALVGRRDASVLAIKVDGLERDAARAALTRFLDSNLDAIDAAAGCRLVGAE